MCLVDSQFCCSGDMPRELWWVGFFYQKQCADSLYLSSVQCLCCGWPGARLFCFSLFCLINCNGIDWKVEAVAFIYLLALCRCSEHLPKPLLCCRGLLLGPVNLPQDHCILVTIHFFLYGAYWSCGGRVKVDSQRTVLTLIMTSVLSCALLLLYFVISSSALKRCCQCRASQSQNVRVHFENALAELLTVLKCLTCMCRRTYRLIVVIGYYTGCTESWNEIKLRPTVQSTDRFELTVCLEIIQFGNRLRWFREAFR